MFEKGRSEERGVAWGNEEKGTIRGCQGAEKKKRTRAMDPAHINLDKREPACQWRTEERRSTRQSKDVRLERSTLDDGKK